MALQSIKELAADLGYKISMKTAKHLAKQNCKDWSMVQWIKNLQDERR